MRFSTDASIFLQIMSFHSSEWLEKSTVEQIPFIHSFVKCALMHINTQVSLWYVGVIRCLSIGLMAAPESTDILTTDCAPLPRLQSDVAKNAAWWDFWSHLYWLSCDRQMYFLAKSLLF